ncbi:MAG: TRAM domain-containing protein [Candidatus Eremiobacteraeota bacterium]|nr:TRAM domain-containing protein [Candidatus Eremiobacteraeota bacterium]
MEKFVRLLFYAIFGLFGSNIGWKLSAETVTYFKLLPPEALKVNAFAFICLGFLMGLAVSPFFANLFLKAIEKVIVHLQKSSLPQILVGSFGLIIGLILSYLITLPLTAIPFSSIPWVGEYLTPLINILIAIFFSYIGVFFGTRMSFAGNLNTLMGTTVQSSDLIWGKNYKVLDTSVIIDGRIADITKTGFIEGTIVIPRFVLRELQQIADSSDSQKRNRGRRGLDMLNTLRKDFGIQILEKDYNEPGVDSKLIKLANEVKATIVTTDYNLNKLASLQEINILNINELANAVKPIMLPGETMKVRIIKEGKEHGQGVAYLEDGTMVVVEGARRHIGEMSLIEVTSSLQTVAGKMIFAKLMRPADAEKEDSSQGKE